MDEDIPEIPEIPFQRGEFLVKLNRLESLRRTTEQYKTMCRMIEKLEEDISQFQPPRNPREDNIQMHDRKTLQVLKRQRERLHETMTSMERQVRKDIEESKKSVTQQHTEKETQI